MQSASYYKLAACSLMLCVSLLTSCQRETQQADFYVFGTVVSVTLKGTDPQTAAQAFASLQNEFQRMHRDWHPWEPGKLTQINTALENGDSVEVPRDILDLVKKAQSMETASDGYFNAGLGALIRLWGFHTSDFPIYGPPPAAAEIEQLLAARPSTLTIQIEGNRLRSSSRATQLDFGGIAKGAAVDFAIQQLQALQIPAAIVNAGGDLRAYHREAEQAWRIAIQSPGGGVLAGLETLGNEAVFTSGNYQRYREHAEQRYPHILNPHTGYPAQHVAAITVIAKQGWLADAAATALLIADPDQSLTIAQRLGIDKILFIDQHGQIFATSAMQKRLLDLPQDLSVQIIE